MHRCLQLFTRAPADGAFVFSGDAFEFRFRGSRRAVMGPLPTSWDPSLDGSEAKTSLLPDDADGAGSRERLCAGQGRRLRRIWPPTHRTHPARGCRGHRARCFDHQVTHTAWHGSFSNSTESTVDAVCRVPQVGVAVSRASIISFSPRTSSQHIDRRPARQ